MNISGQKNSRFFFKKKEKKKKKKSRSYMRPGQEKNCTFIFES